MGRLFNIDSPAMVFLSRVADLMVLNVVMIIVCLPIITIGPALTAMHYVLLKMVRKEEGYLIRPFFRAFKQNFKLATISWIIVLAFVLLFYIDLEILNNSGVDFAEGLRIGLYAVGVIALMTALYIFPLLARFENKLRSTFKNALFMSMLSLPKTALMVVACAVPIVLLFISANFVPVVLLLGITGPGYICAMLYSGTFKRFEPDEEAPSPDEWTVETEGTQEIQETQEIKETQEAQDIAEAPDMQETQHVAEASDMQETQEVAEAAGTQETQEVVGAASIKKEQELQEA